MGSVVRLALFAASVAVATGAPAQNRAWAQESKTAATLDEQARAYFRAGAFELAAKEFVKAFEVEPQKPTRLYNAALAYEKADLIREAAELYARYLAVDPQGSKAVESRARKAALDQRIVEEDAAAATAKAEEAQAERARLQAQSGTDKLKAGEYAQAAEAFAKAFEIGGDAQFLFEQAEALRLGTMSVEAIAAYRHYLREAPEGTHASEARRRQDELEAAQREPKVTDAAPPSPNITSAPAKPQTSYSTLRWIGVGGAGLGAAVLGTSLVFGLKAKSIESDLEGLEASSNDRWTAAMDQKLRDGEDAASTARALAIVGGGLAVTGAVLFFIGGNEASRPERSVSVQPVLRADGGAIVLGGRFW